MKDVGRHVIGFPFVDDSLFISYNKFNRTFQDRADLLVGVSVERHSCAGFQLEENHGHLLAVDHPHFNAGARLSGSHVFENEMVHEGKFTVIR